MSDYKLIEAMETENTSERLAKAIRAAEWRAARRATVKHEQKEASRRATSEWLRKLT